MNTTQREAVARLLCRKVLERDGHPYAANWDSFEPHQKRGWLLWADEVIQTVDGAR